MNLYKKGQLIEVGLGDFIGDRNGRSYFTFIDVDAIDEDEIIELFPDENVLYIEEVQDEEHVAWAKENPISELMNTQKQ